MSSFRITKILDNSPSSLRFAVNYHQVQSALGRNIVNEEVLQIKNTRSGEYFYAKFFVKFESVTASRYPFQNQKNYNASYDGDEKYILKIERFVSHDR